MSISAGAIEARIGADVSDLKSGVAAAAAALRGFEQTAQRSLERALDTSGLAPSIRKGVQDAVDGIRKTLSENLANARDSLANGIIDRAEFERRAKQAGEDAAREIKKQFDALSKAGLIPPEVAKRLTDDLSAAARKAGTEAGRDMTSALEQSIGNVRGALVSLGKQLVLPVAGFFAVGQIKAFGTEFVRAAAAAEESLGRLNAMVIANGNAVGRSASQLTAFSRALQKETLFSAADIERSMSQLLTYHSIAGETFERTMRVATDLSSVFGGLSQSTEALARALDDPILGLAMLAKQGFKFDDATKAQIKTLTEQNRLLEAQDLILKDLESQVGGVAAKMKTGMVGAIDEVGKSWLGFKEAAGTTLVTLGNGEAGARALAGTLQKFSRHTDDAAVAVIAFGKATAIVAGVAGLVKLAAALDGVTLSLTAFKTALTTGLAALNPVTIAIGAAVVATGALALAFYKSGKEARDAAQKVTEYAESLRGIETENLSFQLGKSRELEHRIALAKDLDRQIAAIGERMKQGGAGAVTKEDREKLIALQKLRREYGDLVTMQRQLAEINKQVDRSRASTPDVAGAGREAIEYAAKQIKQLREISALRKLNAQEARQLATFEQQLRDQIAGGTLSLEDELKARQALSATKEAVKEINAALHTLEGGAAVARLLGTAFVGADTEIRTAAESTAKLGADLKQAEDALKTLGSAAPTGAVQHVEDLRSQYATARAELAKLVADWQAAWAKVATPPTPKLAGGIITSKIAVGPTVQQIEQEFNAAVGLLNQKFASGLIDPKALEDGGKEAARQFNAALLRYLETHKLSPEVRAEIQAKLKLDLGGDVRGWKQASSAAATAAQGVINVGDAFGKLSDQSRRALTGVSELARSISSLDLSKGLFTLANAGAITGVVGAVAQFAAAMFQPDPAEEARHRELVGALQDLATQLGGFRATANAIQKTATVSKVLSSYKDPVAASEMFFRALEQQGLTLQEVVAVAKEFGVSLMDDKGRLDARKLASKEFEQVLAQAAKTLVGFRNTLDDQKRRASLRADIFNEPTTAANELAAQMALLTKFMPEFAKGLEGIDTATAEGRARLEAEIQRMFSAFEAGTLDLEDLARDEWLSLIEGFAGAFARFREAADKASGSMQNMPQIFDLALRKRQAALAGIAPIAAPPPPPSGTGPVTPGEARGGGRTRPEPAISVEINNPPAGLDVPATIRQIAEGLTAILREPGMNPLKLAVRGV